VNGEAEGGGMVMKGCKGDLGGGKEEGEREEKEWRWGRVAIDGDSDEEWNFG
jgi:hypothetical protein